MLTKGQKRKLKKWVTAFLAILISAGLLLSTLAWYF